MYVLQYIGDKGWVEDICLDRVSNISQWVQVEQTSINHGSFVCSFSWIIQRSGDKIEGDQYIESQRYHKRGEQRTAWMSLLKYIAY